MAAPAARKAGPTGIKASGALWGDDGLFTTDELIGLDALNVTDIQWDAVGTVGFKNFFDDFNFSVTPVTPVPEPGGAVLVVLAGLFGMRRRRA